MTLDQISEYLLFHLTIESFLFMEMARRSKQEIVRKLPEELFFVIIFIFFWGGGGGGKDRKMFLMSSQTLAMIEKILTVQRLASQGTNENCLAVIGIKYYQSIDFSDRLRASFNMESFSLEKVKSGHGPVA